MQRRSFLANVDPATINFKNVKNKIEKKIAIINSYNHQNYTEDTTNTNPQNRQSRSYTNQYDPDPTVAYPVPYDATDTSRADQRLLRNQSINNRRAPNIIKDSRNNTPRAYQQKQSLDTNSSPRRDYNTRRETNLRRTQPLDRDNNHDAPARDTSSRGGSVESLRASMPEMVKQPSSNREIASNNSQNDRLDNNRINNLRPNAATNQELSQFNNRNNRTANLSTAQKPVYTQEIPKFNSSNNRATNLATEEPRAIFTSQDAPVIRRERNDYYSQNMQQPSLNTRQRSTNIPTSTKENPNYGQQFTGESSRGRNINITPDNNVNLPPIATRVNYDTSEDRVYNFTSRNIPINTLDNNTNRVNQPYTRRDSSYYSDYGYRNYDYNKDTNQPSGYFSYREPSVYDNTVASASVNNLRNLPSSNTQNSSSHEDYAVSRLARRVAPNQDYFRANVANGSFRNPPDRPNYIHDRDGEGNQQQYSTTAKQHYGIDEGVGTNVANQSYFADDARILNQDSYPNYRANNNQGNTLPNQDYTIYSRNYIASPEETGFIDKMPPFPASSTQDHNLFTLPNRKEGTNQFYNKPQGYRDFSEKLPDEPLKQNREINRNSAYQPVEHSYQQRPYSSAGKVPTSYDFNHFAEDNSFQQHQEKELPRENLYSIKDEHFNNNLQEINTKLARMQREYGDLMNKVANYTLRDEDKIAQINEKIDEVADNTVGNYSNLNNIKHNLEKLNNENTDIKKQIKNFSNIEEAKIDTLDKKVNNVMYNTYGASENLHEITHKLNKLVAENESLKKQIAYHIDNEELQAHKISDKINKVAHGTYNNQSNLHDINNSLDHLQEENKNLEKKIYNAAGILSTEVKENTQATLEIDNKIQSILFKIDRMKEENKFLKEIIADNYKSLKNDMENIHNEKNYQLQQYLNKQSDSLKEELKDINPNNKSCKNDSCVDNDNKNDYQSILKQMLQYKMMSMLFSETKAEAPTIKYIDSENNNTNNKQDATLNTLNILEKVKALTSNTADNNILPEVLNELKKANQITAEKFENITKFITENIKEIVRHSNNNYRDHNKSEAQALQQEKAQFYSKIDDLLHEIKDQQEQINTLLASTSQHSPAGDKLFIEDIHRLLKEINDRNKVLTSIYEKEKERFRNKNINEHMTSSVEDDEKKNNYK